MARLGGMHSTGGVKLGHLIVGDERARQRAEAGADAGAGAALVMPACTVSAFAFTPLAAIDDRPVARRARRSARGAADRKRGKTAFAWLAYGR
jgi:hypothetical protein